MGAREPRSENLKGRGTEVTYVYLLGGYFQGHTVTSIICSDFQVYCSYMVGGGTGRRGGLLFLCRLEYWGGGQS